MEMNSRSLQFCLQIAVLVTSLCLTVKGLATSTSPVDSAHSAKYISISEIQNLYDQRKLNPFNEAMQEAMRSAMKEKLLAEIYSKSKQNPDLKIGPGKASEIFSAIDKCQIFQSPKGFSLMAEPNRSSDFYALRTNLAVINLEILESVENFPLGILGIYLHICLGADGIDDRNYDVSLALLSPYIVDFNLMKIDSAPSNPIQVASWDRTLELRGKDQFRISEPAPFAKDPDEKSGPSRLQRSDFTSPSDQPSAVPVKKIPLQLQKGGGYTGVGGGGDAFSFLAKAGMLQFTPVVKNMSDLPEACRARWADPQNFIDEVRALRVESREGLGKGYYFDPQERILWLKKVSLKNFPPALMRMMAFGLVAEFCDGILEIEKAQAKK